MAVDHHVLWGRHDDKAPGDVKVDVKSRCAVDRDVRLEDKRREVRLAVGDPEDAALAGKLKGRVVLDLEDRPRHVDG